MRYILHGIAFLKFNHEATMRMSASQGQIKYQQLLLVTQSQWREGYCVDHMLDCSTPCVSPIHQDYLPRCQHSPPTSFTWVRPPAVRLGYLLSDQSWSVGGEKGGRVQELDTI